MGLSIHYEALPAEGRLLQHLKSDPLLGKLYGALLTCGRGPCFWEDIDSDEQEEILESASGRLEIEAVDVVLARLSGIIARERDAHPGFCRHRAGIEKCDVQIETAIRSELAQRGQPDAFHRVAALLGGSQPLLPNLFEPGDPDQLYLVTASDVASGADVLRGLAPENLEFGLDDHDRTVESTYARWRIFYIGAAERGDIVLVSFAM